MYIYVCVYRYTYLHVYIFICPMIGTICVTHGAGGLHSSETFMENLFLRETCMKLPISIDLTFVRGPFCKGDINWEHLYTYMNI